MITDIAPRVVIDFPIEPLTVDFLQLIKQVLPMLHKQELPLLNHLVPAFGGHGFLGEYVFTCGSVGLGGQLLLLRFEAIPRLFELRYPLLRGKRLLVVSTAELG